MPRWYWRILDERARAAAGRQADRRSRVIAVKISADAEDFNSQLDGVLNDIRQMGERLGRERARRRRARRVAELAAAAVTGVVAGRLLARR